jgi:excisionase family DNA binding protein
MPEFLTVAEVARRLGVSKARAYGLLAAHIVPSVKLGTRRIVVPVEAWDTWWRQQTARALASVVEEEVPRAS